MLNNYILKFTADKSTGLLLHYLLIREASLAAVSYQKIPKILRNSVILVATLTTRHSVIGE